MKHGEKRHHMERKVAKQEYQEDKNVNKDEMQIALLKYNNNNNNNNNNNSDDNNNHHHHHHQL